MPLEARQQRLGERHQGTRIELLARLAEGRGAHAVSQRLVMEYLEEALELILDAALAQVQQQGNEMGQRERSLAGEIRGIDACTLRKLLGEQEFLYGRINKFKFDSSAGFLRRWVGSSWAGGPWLRSPNLVNDGAHYYNQFILLCLS